MKASILQTAQQVMTARPGLYVVRSGSEAYFPVMGLIEGGYAEFEGEHYDDQGRVVTVHVTTSPPLQMQQMMMQNDPVQRRIAIGPDFFIKSLNDYNNWPIKWWREAIQNSVDGGGTHIALDAIKQEDGTMLISCDDDGRGMDEDTVVNKFLTLGATTKTGPSGAAGGFGKAKEMLLFPWIAWRIYTRDMLIEGAAGRQSADIYTITPAPMRKGTRVEVVMPPDKYTSESFALAFLEKCYLPNIHFTVNGKPTKANLVGVDLINSIPGKVDIFFTPAKSKQSYLYVRARGLYMFESHIGEVPGFVLVELIAPSIEILSANRDGFRDNDVESAVSQLSHRIAKDNLSAFKSKQGMIRQKFEGTGKFRAKERASAVLDRIGPYGDGALSVQNAESIIFTMSSYVQGGAEAGEEKLQSMPSTACVEAMLDQKFLGPNHLEAAVKQLVWEPDFFIVNEINGYHVPKKFFPATMTPTVLKLAKTWVELCRYVMMQLGSSEHFGAGFVFSTSAAAQAITTDEDKYRSWTSEDEKWIMLNPFKDMYDRKAIWRPAHDADLKWLYAAAIHEATHIADRIQYHDESFSSALTMNMAKCADGFRKIRAIAAGIRTRGAGGSPEADEYMSESTKNVDAMAQFADDAPVSPEEHAAIMRAMGLKT